MGKRQVLHVQSIKAKANDPINTVPGYYYQCKYNGWQVKARQISDSTFDTLVQATKFAVSYARKVERAGGYAAVRVYKRNGRLAYERKYG